MSNFLVTGTSPDDYDDEGFYTVPPPVRRQPLRDDVLLSNGTIIRYEYALNGSQNAFPVGRESRAMTDEEFAEWQTIFHAPVKSPYGKPGEDW